MSGGSENSPEEWKKGLGTSVHHGNREKEEGPAISPRVFSTAVNTRR
jgi:hypothetical protein